MSSAPFSEDALNRYRITHSDRDLKPLLKRLHRIPLSKSSDSLEENDIERQLVRLEVLKWRAGIERIMGSVANLKRQKEDYEKQSLAIVERTEKMQELLQNEKEDLEKARTLRDHRAKCDGLATKIKTRSKTKAELDEDIAALQNSLEEQRASHDVYVQTSQTRSELFSQVIKLIEDCRGIKLPVDPLLATAIIEKAEPAAESSTGPVSSYAKLNAAAPSFQPTSKASPSSNPLLKPPSAGHSLPSRPSASPLPFSNNRGQNASRLGSYGLPSRPTSSMRGVSATGHRGKTATSLEDGEVGPEEGELDERGVKRAPEAETSKRVTRRRM
ncbi:uncharacterized protein L203_103095 [Cryptococcus depauperatus CBS 7841]|uniref:Uncharacterized protein n=1 Tax=Cryptococcus depauperatus CBS 7841 TaxID=1295531 RepID=A0A1E3IPL1_9TREE|nr:hypothetical protein L203_01631 [Cryptococcus depauperatus CBS 7841]